MVREKSERSMTRQIFIFQIPFVLYAALIYIVSSISRLPTPDLGLTFADKLIHVIEYGLFCYFGLRAMRNPPLELSLRLAYPLATAVTVVYAALDEYHQSFVPGRNADVIDLLADSFGALVALLLYHIVKERRRMSF